MADAIITPVTPVQSKPVLNPNLKFRYGIWTGGGYSAGGNSAPFVPLTQAQIKLRGFDDFDTYVSKPHDISYDKAQRTLIEDINSGVSNSDALIKYYTSISAADVKFIADAKIYKADTVWGETIRIDGMTAFAPKIEMQNAVVKQLQTDPTHREKINPMPYSFSGHHHVSERAGLVALVIGNLPDKTNKIKSGLFNLAEKVPHADIPIYKLISAKIEFPIAI